MVESNQFEPKVIYADHEGYFAFVEVLKNVTTILNNIPSVWSDLFSEKFTHRVLMDWIWMPDFEKNLKRHFLKVNDISIPVNNNVTVKEDELLKILNFPERKLKLIVQYFDIIRSNADNIKSKNISFFDLFDSQTLKFSIPREVELKLYDHFEIRTTNQRENDFIETLEELQNIFFKLKNDFGRKSAPFSIMPIHLKCYFKGTSKSWDEWELNHGYITNKVFPNL